jgi:hypothetical protein
MAAEQHTEAVTRQPQFDIQGIMPAANAIYISAPIAHVAKKGTQSAIFPGLALAAGTMGEVDSLLTHTQKQCDAKSSQMKDPGDEFLLKFEEVQRAAFYDPLNCILNNISKLLMNIIDRRGGRELDGQLGISRQAQIFFVII